ncbi:hypothetical protein H2248_007838 [Termitomyces sp. 'cryptogamus']|nr:hypothetical protein H2248_007838 [Termitomyces sp. 'cryptogamus']
MTKSRKARVVKGGFRLEQLPVELLQEVLSFTTSSAGVYRSLLLVSKSLNSIVKLHCLQVVPVVLQGIEKLRSFDRLLASSPKSPSYVRYLWIYGQGLKEWELIDSIVARCSNVVALSCNSRTLASLCSSPSFLHTRCTELTLIESWHDWKPIVAARHGSQYCAQITHLRLYQGLDPEFPKRYFTNLTHLAFSCSPIGDYLKRYSGYLSGLRSLLLIVATNAEWHYNSFPDASVSELLENDRRFAILQCREDWTEFGAWRDRIRGGRSLWEQAEVSRKSMQVFRDAFKIPQG